MPVPPASGDMRPSVPRRRVYGVCAVGVMTVLLMVGLMRDDDWAGWVAAALAWAGCAVVLLATAGRAERG